MSNKGNISHRENMHRGLLPEVPNLNMKSMANLRPLD